MGPRPSPASPLLPGCELSSSAVTYVLYPCQSHSNQGNGPQARHSKTGARTKPFCSAGSLCQVFAKANLYSLQMTPSSICSSNEKLTDLVHDLKGATVPLRSSVSSPSQEGKWKHPCQGAVVRGQEKVALGMGYGAESDIWQLLSRQ